MNTTTKKTILVVEDDVVLSSSIRELLEYNNYHTLSASNGVDGLKTLRSISNTSLILLDLMMPEMDGFQFREQQLLDSSIKNIPVIVMSADGRITEKKEKAAVSEP